MNNNRAFAVSFAVAAIVTVAIMIAVGIYVPSKDPVQKLKLVVSYGMVTLLFLFALLVVAAIAIDKINIGSILEEHGGGASMSRFQLLIFTFVIGLSFFLIVICDCKFPDVPANVLALLGISATTYGVSKGIQASSGPLDGKGPKQKGTTQTQETNVTQETRTTTSTQ